MSIATASISLPRCRAALLACMALVATWPPDRTDANADLPRLTVSGGRLVDASGRPVLLKGCNLGNWLLIEPWMLAIDDPQIRDQYDFISILKTRFGADRAERLMDVYRANWITPREFQFVKSFGFNVVRVPFDHGLLAHEDKPFALRSDAFEWLDKAVDMAEQAGVYVILDMHSVPGGQSTEMPSGRIGENNLWESEAAQRKTAWLWQRIAERYRDRSAVVAYDLMNEPWSDYQEDVRSKLVSIVDRIHAAIRKVDPAKLIFAPGSLRGISFYGRPQDHGWTNLGYTEHYYPGIFGNGSPSLETHARFLSEVLPAKAKLIKRLRVPFLVGEFNVVFDTVAQPELMRRYYDTFASHGWLATLWALRMITPEGGVHPNNWYLVTNAKPFRSPDPRKASYDEIEAAFRQLGSMPLVADEALRTALTTPKVEGPVLARRAYSPVKTLSVDRIEGWTGQDISATPAGGTKRNPDGSVVLYGGGSDVWAGHDEFRYLYHNAKKGDFSVTAWLTAFDAPHVYAKAGWMLRESLEPDAAHVFVHAFPDGRVMLAWRSKRGATTEEKVLSIGGFPVGLGIERTNGQVAVRWTDPDGVWQRSSAPAPGGLAEGAFIGLVVSSHQAAALASATFEGLTKPLSKPLHPTTIGKNLLTNASFEYAKDTSGATDQARGWDRWGQWFNREEGWTPRRQGQCVLGYHHWRIEAADNSGVYQDVSGISPGSRCTFSVYANRDVPAADKHGPESIELRIESPYKKQLLTVSSHTYRVGDVATAEGWSLLRVVGTIPTDKARVLIIVNPSGTGPRDAAVKFDKASFRVEQDEER